MIRVKITKTVDKPLKDLWKLTVLDFEKIGSWASGVHKSWKGNNHDRICETSIGKLYENITLKDDKNHKMVVDAKGLPFFVKKLTGTWTFKKINHKKTEFTINLEVITMPVIGTFMEIFMRPNLQKTIKQSAEDYKTYLETGKISENKRKEKEMLANK